MKIFQTKYGNFTTFNNDTDLNNILYKNKIPDEEIYELLKPHILTSHLVIDIGSTIGIRTIIFTKINPSIEIYCFEPRENFLWLLTKNLAENNILNTVLMNNMIGHINGNINIPLLLNRIICDHNDIIQLGNGSIIGFENDPVEFVTLDSLKLLNCDFIFIDLKGFDYLVILGGINTIKKYKPKICFKKSDVQTNKIFQKFGIPINNETNSSDLLEKIGYKLTFISNEFILAIPFTNTNTQKNEIEIKEDIEVLSKSEQIDRLVKLGY
jgi:FkbM family methyltransferase